MINNDIQVNIGEVRKVLGNSPDLVVREWGSNDNLAVRGAVIYISGLTDVTFINQFIIEPLLSNNRDSQQMTKTSSMDDCKQLLLPVGAFKKRRSFMRLYPDFYQGKLQSYARETTLLC